MTYAESDIAYEGTRHWVLRLPSGCFEVYRCGATHSTRVASIGYSGADGLNRAIAEVMRRDAESTR